MIEPNPSPNGLGVGDGIFASEGEWTFSGHTAKVFPEHVRRSIPNYVIGHQLICEISKYFVKQDGRMYDLGTSRAELLLRLHMVHGDGVNFIGIDNEPDMISQASRAVAAIDNASVILADIRNFRLEPCQLVAAYYTLQFVPYRDRHEVISAVYQALDTGGCFLLFEKVVSDASQTQKIIDSTYSGFKKDRGYSDEEIAQKSRSLRGVMEPLTSAANRKLLLDAGFVGVETIYKYLGFEGFIALK